MTFVYQHSVARVTHEITLRLLRRILTKSSVRRNYFAHAQRKNWYHE
jgi:hypothetical protein